MSKRPTDPAALERRLALLRLEVRNACHQARVEEARGIELLKEINDRIDRLTAERLRRNP